jgi:uncharacterized protein (DUF1697 family)
MTDLQSMCRDAGCTEVRTYIASGNAVFLSRLSESALKAALEQRLQAYAGNHVEIAIRTHAEMAAVLAANPFPHAPPNRTVAIFLDAPPPADALAAVTGRKQEELRLGTREIYVLYGEDMGTSRLKIPAAKHGTARNINTVAKLAAMAAALTGA